MWFNDKKNKNMLMTYEVYNDAYSYDENYSESSTEFMIASSYAGEGISLNYAKESIMSAIMNKLKSNFYENLYVDESYGDSYNDCSGGIYSED